MTDSLADAPRQLPLMGTEAERLDREAERVMATSALKAGYVLRRILLVNYWHFDYQELIVLDGRLTIRGGNGAGKSTIVGGVIPTLLDGSTHPNHIDTHGDQRARKIEDYVLDRQKDRSIRFKQRTSYLAMEFAWKGDPANGHETGDHPDYYTLGMCLVGRSNATDDNPVRVTRFILAGELRLGFHIPLTARDGTALDEASFVRVLRQHGGTVYNRQKDYQETVARELFGITDPETFSHLIDVMLLLRRPQLGANLADFEIVQGFIKQALPSLPSDLKEEIAQGFERLNGHRKHLMALRGEASACAAIYREDLAYARASGKLQALPFLRADRELRQARRELSAKQRAKGELEKALGPLSTKVQDLERKREALGQRIESLRESAEGQQAERLTRDVAEAETREREADVRLREAQSAALQVERELKQLKREMVESLERWDAAVSETREGLASFEEGCRRAGWADASGPAALVTQALALLDIAGERPPALPAPDPSVAQAIGGWQQRLRGLAEAHRHLEELQGQERSAQQARDRMEKGAGEQSEQVRRAEEALETGWREAARAIAAWIEANPGSKLAPTELAEAARQRDLEAVRQALDSVARRAGQATEGLVARLEGLRDQVASLEQHQKELQGELESLQRARGSLRGRHPQRETALAALTAAGIDARPFYALVDFAPSTDLATQGRIERALEDAGLLDALLVRAEQAVAADRLLQAQGLSDCRWKPRQAGRGPAERLLRVDPAVAETAWRHLAAEAIGSLTGIGFLATLATGGEWNHGLLKGHAAEPRPAGFIGAAQRQKRIDTLRDELQTLAREHETLDQEAMELRSYRTRLQQEVAQLTALAAVTALAAAQVRLEERRAVLSEARSQLEAAERLLAARAAERQAAAEALGKEMVALGAQGPNRNLVSEMLAASARVPDLWRALDLHFRGLADRWNGHRQQKARETQLEDREAEAIEKASTEAELRSRASEELKLKRRLLEESGALDLIRQLREAREEDQRCLGRVMSAIAERAKTEEQLGQARTDEEKAAEEVERAQVTWQTGRDDFARFLAVNTDAATGEGEGDARLLSAARELLPSGGGDQSGLVEELRVAFTRLNRALDEHRAVLIRKDPFLSEDERKRVVVRLDGDEVGLDRLGAHLGAEIERVNLILSKEEQNIIRDLLCKRGLDALHRSMVKARLLVKEMDSQLRGLWLAGESYSLEMRPREDRREIGGELAARYPLFERSFTALPEAEREALTAAVERTIAQVHERVAAGEGRFRDLLEQSLDYREWFSLQLKVKNVNETEMAITKRLARVRSGAQQQFALYVPLLAALAAISENAAPWTPRLAVIDEVCSNADPSNTVKFLAFLVDMKFQWILVSARVGGSNLEGIIPACSDYVVEHNEAEFYAQAIPFLRHSLPAAPDNGRAKEQH